MSIERIRNYIIENAKKEAEQLIKTAEEQFRNETVSAKLSLEKKYQEMLQADEEHLREDMKRFFKYKKFFFCIHFNFSPNPFPSPP